MLGDAPSGGSTITSDGHTPHAPARRSRIRPSDASAAEATGALPGVGCRRGGVRCGRGAHGRRCAAGAGRARHARGHPARRGPRRRRRPLDAVAGGGAAHRSAPLGISSRAARHRAQRARRTASPARGRGFCPGGAVPERPKRFVYELTGAGHELAGALRLLADWGARHREGGEPPRHGPAARPWRPAGGVPPASAPSRGQSRGCTCLRPGAGGYTRPRRS